MSARIEALKSLEVNGRRRQQIERLESKLSRELSGQQKRVAFHQAEETASQLVDALKSARAHALRPNRRQESADAGAPGDTLRGGPSPEGGRVTYFKELTKQLEALQSRFHRLETRQDQAAKLFHRLEKLTARFGQALVDLFDSPPDDNRFSTLDSALRTARLVEGVVHGLRHSPFNVSGDFINRIASVMAGSAAKIHFRLRGGEGGTTYKYGRDALGRHFRTPQSVSRAAAFDQIA